MNEKRATAFVKCIKHLAEKKELPFLLEEKLIRHSKWAYAGTEVATIKKILEAHDYHLTEKENRFLQFETENL